MGDEVITTQFTQPTERLSESRFGRLARGEAIKLGTCHINLNRDQLFALLVRNNNKHSRHQTL